MRFCSQEVVYLSAIKSFLTQLDEAIKNQEPDKFFDILHNLKRTQKLYRQLKEESAEL